MDVRQAPFFHWVSLGIFFLYVFLYVFYQIDPVLIHHIDRPGFFRTAWYFSSFATRPGGLSGYAAEFLLSLFQFRLVGTVLFVFAALCISLLTRHIILCFPPYRQPDTAHVIPVICIVLLLSGYYSHPIQSIVAYLISLGCTVGYIRFSPQTRQLRLGLYLISAVGVYYCAGGFVFYFMILCCLYEVFTYRAVFQGIGMVASILILPYIASFFFPVMLSEAYGMDCIPHLPRHGMRFLFPAHMLFLPFYLCGVMLFRTGSPPISEPCRGMKRIVSRILPAIMKNPFFILLFPISFFCIAAFLSFNVRTKVAAQISYYAEHRMWDEVLEKNRTLQSPTVLSNYFRNRALYHKGLLLSQLFSVPQTSKQNNLVLPNKLSCIFSKISSDIYWDLGHVNAAERWAYEAFNTKDQSPAVLKRIVQVHLVKQQFDSARKFLNLLKTMLYTGEWVRRHEKYLQNPELMVSDPQLNAVVSVKPDSDFIMVLTDPHVDLIALVNQGKSNRMAFAYAIAWFLQQGKFRELSENIAGFRYFGFKSLPRHFEEALMYLVYTKRLPFEVRSNYIEDKTFEQFGVFLALTRRSERDPNARKSLQEKFAGTYWYYLLREGRFEM